MGGKQSRLQEPQEAVEVPWYWQTEMDGAAIEAIEAEDDYYRLLCVSERTTTKEIRAHYLELQRRAHPDKRGDVRVAMKLNGVYDVLMDPTSRKRYDTDRGSFLKKNIFYAKQVAGSLYASVSTAYSHYVDWEELNLSDHVYFYMAWSNLGTQHHGIVSAVGDSKNDVRIIDFGVWDPSFIRPEDKGKGLKPVREVGYETFLPANRYLRRAVYNESCIASSMNLVASYRDDADKPDVVLRRARRLLMLQHVQYDLLNQSCETIAFWCKTGKRYSGQATKAQRTLGTAASALTVATGTVVGITVVTTGLVVEAEVVGGTILVLSGGAIAGLAVGGVATVSALAYVGLIAYRAHRRAKLGRAQPPEMIKVISELESRERRAYAKNEMYDTDPVLGLASRLDAIAEGKHDHQDMSPGELADSVGRMLGVAFESHQTLTGNDEDGGADDLVPFAVQCLARCGTFNAILDLPGIGSECGQTAYYLTTLKAAELMLLESRKLTIDDVVVSVQSKATRDASSWRRQPQRRTLTLTTRIRDAHHRSYDSTVDKVEKDFLQLHRIIAEVHPAVQNLKLPDKKTGENCTDAFTDYITTLITLSEASPNLTNFDLPVYLECLQATELREQLAFFLDPTALIL